MPSIFHSVYVYNTCCVKLRWNSARFFFLNTLAHIFRYLLQTFNYYIHIVYNKDRYSGFLFNLAIWNLHLYNKLYVTVSHWISTSESNESNSKNNENLNSHNELFDTSIFLYQISWLIHIQTQNIYMY